MSPHRRPLMTSIQTLVRIAREWRRLSEEDGPATKVMRDNVCSCEAHGYPHQRSLGRCIEPRVLSVAGP